MPAIYRNVQQEFRHIAGAKHLMNRREASGTLVRPEVRCKNAAADALSPQKLARAAWRRWRNRRRRVGVTVDGIRLGENLAVWSPASVGGRVVRLLVSHWRV